MHKFLQKFKYKHIVTNYTKPTVQFCQLENIPEPNFKTTNKKYLGNNKYSYIYQYFIFIIIVNNKCLMFLEQNQILYSNINEIGNKSVFAQILIV